MFMLKSFNNNWMNVWNINVFFSKVQHIDLKPFVLYAIYVNKVMTDLFKDTSSLNDLK